MVVAVSAFAQDRAAQIREKLLSRDTATVLVAAHRGDWRNFPENSLEAIESAINMGVDIVEIDLQRTKDGQLILMHDDRLNRTTNGKGVIADTTLAYIRTLYLKNGCDITTKHRVPTLEEALLLAKGRVMLNLDKADRYFEEVYEVIDAYHGTLIEFLGDGLFVVFGAPMGDPDHAAHAVACAIGMQNAMPEVNQWNREHGYPALKMGIGVCTGTCVVGNIGSEQKMKYGCVGESVNLAGRVESQTVGSQILITESTAALLKEPLTTAGEFSFLPKGAKEPVTVYDVTAMGTEYRLEKKTGETAWIRLEEPPTVDFYLLNENKSVDQDRLKGEVRSVSGDGSLLKLRTPAPPAFHQNVLIDIGGNLYGKVTGQEGEEAVVCLTAFPDCFESWFKNLK